jgi:tetratricopeptide (TPR) repeat protein
MCYTFVCPFLIRSEAKGVTESLVETNAPESEETRSEDATSRLNPPGAFTSFLIAAAVAYVGMLVFVFAFGMYGDRLTAGIDTACAEAAFPSGQEAESRGNYELAIQRYRQALQGRFADKAREYQCGRSLGEALLRVGRYEEALDAYRSLPPEAFTSAGHWTGYVTSLFRAGQYEETMRSGAEWLAKAQAANDREQILWAGATLGRAAEQLGDLDEALNYYRTTSVVAPDGDGDIRMAGILKMQGKTADAIRLLDAYLDKVQSGPLHEEAAKLRAECAVPDLQAQP